LDLEKTGHLFATVNYVDPKAEKYEEIECLLCNDVIVLFRIKDYILSVVFYIFYRHF
jgi:hypothetical protein